MIKILTTLRIYLDCTDFNKHYVGIRLLYLQDVFIIKKKTYKTKLAVNMNPAVVIYKKYCHTNIGAYIILYL